MTEGKFSFPAIHAIKTSPKSSQIPSILRQRTTNIELKKQFVLQLKEAGSISYTEEKLKSLVNEIKSEISGFGGNPHLDGLVDALAKKLAIFNNTN